MNKYYRNWIFFVFIVGVTFFCTQTLFAQSTNKATSNKIQIQNGESAPGTNPIVKKNIPVSPFAACSDLGGENGWSSYTAATGFHQKGGSPDPTFFAPVAPVTPRFNLTSGAGVDPCTQGTTGPPIPLVCPGFGNASIQLGQPNTSGLNGGCANSLPYPPPGVGAAGNGCSEQLRYPLTVGPQDTNFIYAYALVLENPPGGHTAAEAPFSEIYILKANGDTVPCSHRKYIADLNGGVGNGFFQASCAGSLNPGYPPAGMIVSYKPWTLEGVNLSAFVGQNLTVVITNSDCALGGHYCYSYWDFSCGSLSTNPASYCVGNSVTITAPTDPIINYTYQWSHNGQPYTGAPNSTSQTIIPFPQPGDTFAVLVSQPSGCPFYITYVPTPMQVTSNFNYTPLGTCGSGVVSFTDSSYTPNGTPIVVWNWSFPGGSPTSSISQNPSGIIYSPGTYSVSLIVTSQQGCIDTVIIPIIVSAGIDPVAAAITAPVCFNNPTLFTDQSVGNPTVAQWNWNFGDGSTSTSQNPSHTYGAPGTYSVTLIITNTSSCVDTVNLLAIINPLPLALFSSTPVCVGNQSCFTDASTVTPGTITGWSWNFGDPTSGAANISTAQNPCHTFSGPGTFTVILTATTDSGCQSTTMLPANVYPLPTAAIIPKNVCLNALTPFTDASTSPAGSPINAWSWNFGDGSPNDVNQNPSHTYSTPGTYTITLIVTTVQGCKDTTTSTAVIYNPPIALYSDSVKGCAPVCATFNDLSTSIDGTIASWQWSFPGGNPAISGLQNPKVCWNKPGVYGASLIVTSSYGCVDSVATPLYITVYDWPVANFCVAPTVASITDPNFVFCDLWSNSVTSWMWDFGDGSPKDSINTDPAHSYSLSVLNNDFYYFTISLAVQNIYGCWDTISKTIEILPEFTFYIPNTFTPNQDGMNELFFGKGRGIKEYEIWVFDRWGNLLWNCEHTGKNTDFDSPGQDGLSSFCKWDGKVVGGGMDMSGQSGQLMQEDVYVWKVRLIDVFNKRHAYIGHVNVVR